MITAPELAEFEAQIAKEYEAGNIRAPVHLRSGNEPQLCKLFKEANIGPRDYVCSTWASHLHALLKGVPRDEVYDAIMQGRSITLNFPEHKFYSSAIVGGIGPIATGLAWAVKKRGQRVVAFIGDMALRHGTVHESICFSIGHDLPVLWVVEDNGVSVCTDTEETCGVMTVDLVSLYCDMMNTNDCRHADLVYYDYENGFPHSGTGTFVEF